MRFTQRASAPVAPYFSKGLCRLRFPVAGAQKRTQVAAHHVSAHRVFGTCAVEQRRQHAELHLGRRLRRGAALREAAHAVLRREERLELQKRLAYVGRIGRVQVVGQKGERVGLEVVGVKLHVGQPIALNVAAGMLPIHKQVVFHVVARDEPLGLEHRALGRLHEAHGAREAVVGGHKPLERARVVEAPLRQIVEGVLELARRVVPNHDAARRRGRKGRANCAFSCPITSFSAI